ncbi:transposase [Ktedonobacter robiniae]|uniref:Transposase IS116/IS110/IS902 C-terminal domain-containing protein n=1 Tax=Ktedonobacter robiniae TaxID=2778365 RepID=A0ABQ3V4M0_9CHLR|nr:transposase [Ktedonobacter robiniae]GHO59948.1 hypothetical protein KSB_84230 [Ktedonobacter robiniae]
MSCFPSAKHLASWAGVCPGNRKSAGKRLRGEKRQGNAFLQAPLAEVVWTISHTKGNFLSAQYHRLVRCIGKPKAVVAVMHSVLVIIYHVLAERKPYEDLGENYYEQHDQEHVMKQALRRLEACGYAVMLTPLEEVAT